MHMLMNSTVIMIFLLMQIGSNCRIRRGVSSEAVDYTVENVSAQPWPTFFCLLDLRDREDETGRMGGSYSRGSSSRSSFIKCIDGFNFPVMQN